MKRFLKYDTKDVENGDINVGRTGVMYPQGTVMLVSESGKKFLLSVNDSGELSTSEISSESGSILG